MPRQQLNTLTISIEPIQESLQRILSLVADSLIRQPLSACSYQQRVDVPLYLGKDRVSSKMPILCRVDYDPSSNPRIVVSCGITESSTPKSLEAHTESK